MPLQATSGAASYDAFGGGVPVVPTYIEDVMSTWLYTGTGASQTITNGIDLSGKGGMVWLKTRNVAGSNYVQDTARGATQSIYTNSTAASGTANILSSFTSSGFVDNNQFSNGDTIASWTFRKQPKFFDCGTFTAGESTNRRISHALGSAPAFIIIKNTSQVGAWYCYHRSLGRSSYLELQSTNAQDTGISNVWGTSDPTSTDFGVKETAFFASGDTVVYYVFAHDAGGFGLTGTDNVISCGSFNYNTDPQTVTLGYEPQWLMVKQTDGVGDWIMFDNMRGFTANSGGGIGRRLFANTSGAETTNDGLYYGGATGFSLNLPAYGNYIYIAIRRGPMKVPTVGTSVFIPLALNNASGTVNTTGFPIDLQMQFYRDGGIGASNSQWVDRLRGFSSTSTQTGPRLYTPSTDAENDTALGTLFNNTGFRTSGNWASIPMVYWNWRRAPGFFDEVCYTGTGSAATINHNLGVVPELIIFKNRSGASNWPVNVRSINTNNWVLNLEENSLQFTSTLFSSAPTSSTMTFTGASVNATSSLYVAYLFATCAGVSKVGSYTGNGTNQTIDCGFTAGARFVLIKRATSGGGATTGDWYVWDSARGIVAGNDPRLSLNTTAAEVTTDDSVDTDNSGFIVNQLSATNINFTSATYIFLAIA